MKEHDRVKGFHRVAEMELRWPGRDVSLGGNPGPWGLGPGHCPVRLLILGSESLYAEGPERGQWPGKRFYRSVHSILMDIIFGKVITVSEAAARDVWSTPKWDVKCLSF